MSIRRPSRTPLLFATFLGLAGTLPAAAQGNAAATQDTGTIAETTTPEVQEVDLLPIPQPDLEDLDPLLGEVLIERELDAQRLVRSGEDDPGALSEAFGELGLVYHAHELWQSAEAAYKNASLCDPTDLRWVYGLGLLYKDNSKLELAKVQLERSLEMLPQNLAGLINLAHIYLELNDVSRAKDLATKALELSPLSPSGLVVLAEVALSERRYDDAIEALNQALDQQPEANRLHHTLGLAYRGAGNLEKAKEHLNQRGEVGVRPPDPLRTMLEDRKTGERVLVLEGRRAFAAGRYKEAAEAFQRALDANPESTGARLNLASALGMGGDIKAGLDHLDKVLEREPDHGEANFNYGFLLLNSNDPEGALPYLEKALQKNSSDLEARQQLGRCLLRLGRISDAAEHLVQVASDRVSDENAQLEAAQALIDLGEYVRARDLMSHAYRLAPQQGRVAHSMAILLSSAPDLSVRNGELAVRLASRVFEASKMASHAETLAKALAEAGRCQEAASLQQQIFEGAESRAQAPQLEIIRQDLERYRSGPPCRLPGSTNSEGKP